VLIIKLYYFRLRSCELECCPNNGAWVVPIVCKAGGGEAAFLVSPEMKELVQRPVCGASKLALGWCSVSEAQL
jgi:hypothetical protein